MFLLKVLFILLLLFVNFVFIHDLTISISLKLLFICCLNTHINNFNQQNTLLLLAQKRYQPNHDILYLSFNSGSKDTFFCTCLLFSIPFNI